jgi:hypothetical protein
MVEAPGIEPALRYRQKPSRDAYLTNNCPISLLIVRPVAFHP